MTGHVELVDELLEVQRLGLARDVLGGDRGAPDDEHVDAGVDHALGELLGPLRRQRAGHGDPGVAHLLQPRGDQLGLDRLGVDLLQPPGRVAALAGAATSSSSGVGSSYRVQRPSRLSTPSPPSLPNAIAVSGDITESIGAASTGQLEPVGVDLPGDADLLGVAGTPRRDDRDVVEGVGAAGPLGPADLDLGHGVADR